MLKIELLINNPHFIPHLAKIWIRLIGKIFAPDITLDMVEKKLNEHLNDVLLPITWVAIDNNKPVGMCSLRANDGVRNDLTPWLGSLVVNEIHQNQGIGKKLINIVKEHAKTLGFEFLYLFTFDPKLPQYYQSLGWEKIGTDEFKSRPITIMQIKL